MIGKDLAHKVLGVALESGADFAEIYIEDTVSNSIDLIGDKIENANYKRIYGTGIRVMLGDKTAYAYTAGTDEEDLIKAARDACATIKSDKRAQILPFVEKDYGAVPKIAAQDVDNEQRAKYLRRAAKAAKNYSDEISQVIVKIVDSDKKVLVCNNEGVFAKDRRLYLRLVVAATAKNENEVQSGRASPGFGAGYESFEDLNIEELGINAAKAAVTMLHAKDCPSGTFPVVIDGGFGGVIFHEACGHSLEATAVALGNSEFCGKLGEKIAADCVTAIDDGTMPFEWGSVGMDDEGNETRKRVLIENGILKSYMIDKLGARRMNTRHTASSRRQDYTFAPTSRMSNTFIAAGNDDEDEMIKTMGTGLYAKSMGGGSVNPLTGDFNFSVSEGYWVKNGEIICPVRGATLIGKGADVLMKIDKVGKNMTMAAGLCGSKSGSVPTNVGQPRIRVTAMTVGGKGGEI